MSKTIMGKYKTLINHGKDYLNTRYDLLRLELVEKVSSIVALLILVMVGLVLVTSVWVYISCILIVLLERAIGSFILAFCIMGVVSLILLGLVLLYKDQLILNPLVRRFSLILFENTIDDEDEDDEEIYE